MKKYLFLIPLAFLVISCSSEEKIIGGSSDPWKVMAVIGETQPALTVIGLPENSILNNDIYFEANGKKMSSAPTRIADFRNFLYLFFPDEYKIEILDKSTFKLNSTVDFSSAMLKPTDICFPNSTDAYITHGNDSVVTLLDITNFQIARTIPVGKFPRAINCSGNQIYVANFGDNSVSVIDSRTHKQEAKITVAPCPIFIEPNSSGEEMIVLSAGNGKIDSDKEKTPAVATFIEVATRNVLHTIEIGLGVQKAIDQIPQGMAISQKDWAFIATNNTFFRLDLRTRTRLTVASSKKYSALGYNFRRLELLMLSRDGEKSWLEVGDQSTGKSLNKFNLPDGVKTILPL